MQEPSNAKSAPNLGRFLRVFNSEVLKTDGCYTWNELPQPQVDLT
jgi:hypothetical protein